MAGARVQINKAHKSRFSSKSSRNVHKTFRDKRKIAKPESNAKGARAARIQRSKMVRDQKRASLLNDKRILSSSSISPRVIVLVGLSATVDLSSLAEDLLALLLNSGSGCVSPVVASSAYKFRATVLKAPHGDLISCMEMAKVADMIAFVASAASHCEGTCSEYIDSFGAQCLSVFRSIGLPSTVVLIRNLPTEQKRVHDVKKACISSLTSEFPEDCRFYLADAKEDLHKFLWQFREQRLTIPCWRSQRPYILSQKLQIVKDDTPSGKCTLLLSGYLRGRNLSANQLVYVSNLGDHTLGKVEILKDPFPMSSQKGQDLMESDEICDLEVIQSLFPDPLKQEPLLVENVPDPIAGEQTWPTDAEMAEADRMRIQLKKSKLSNGSSRFQVACIADDTDGEELSGSTDVNDEIMAMEVGETGLSDPECSTDIEADDASNTSNEATELDSQIMGDDDESLTRQQMEDSMKRIKEAHAEDEEFPDEVDTPLDVPARQRFLKYRGLKSFRTSTWDPRESLPSEYGRIFAFDNFPKTYKHVTCGEASDHAKPGSYVKLHVLDVSVAAASNLVASSTTSPVIACGLFRHESKMSVLHFSIKKNDAYEAPIRSKDELLFHVGFRQFVARPMFSSDNFNSDKHKMERFLHPGRFSIASVYAPISFPPLPLVVLKPGTPTAVAAFGSLRSIDPDRIVLKKIILTGYPHRVSRFKAVVRYMFHTPEDVRWFKPVEVWTECGRHGRIKDSVGTHGAMKCVFNGVLQQRDTVCLSLYKRVYPKWPEKIYRVLGES